MPSPLEFILTELLEGIAEREELRYRLQCCTHTHTYDESEAKVAVEYVLTVTIRYWSKSGLFPHSVDPIGSLLFIAPRPVARSYWYLADTYHSVQAGKELKEFWRGLSERMSPFELESLPRALDLREHTDE